MGTTEYRHKGLFGSGNNTKTKTLALGDGNAC